MAQAGSKGGGLRVIASERAQPFVYGETQDDVPEMPLAGAMHGTSYPGRCSRSGR